MDNRLGSQIPKALEPTRKLISTSECNHLPTVAPWLRQGKCSGTTLSAKLRSFERPRSEAGGSLGKARYIRARLLNLDVGWIHACQALALGYDIPVWDTERVVQQVFSHGGRPTPTSTVGRGKAVTLLTKPTQTELIDGGIRLHLGNSLDFYPKWDNPVAIVSDGAYGILGFEGDTSDHLDMPAWYEPHIIEWSKKATAKTTLWFWNSEIGWASVHPVLEKHGWRYVNANIWNKGKAHIAGNVNTGKIRRFPVVTEVCVQYVYEARIDGLSLQHWLYREWKRTGLALRRANEACGVADAAVRKYLDQGHLWYFPPPEMFEKMCIYANTHGKPDGRPYFSRDGLTPMSRDEWGEMRSIFNCPVGFTNVWDRNPLKGSERIRVPKISGKAAHLNQKPLDLLSMIIEASSLAGDVVWEPFGGLFSASLAAKRLGRAAFGCEIDPTYFQLGLSRFSQGYLFNQ